MTPDPITFLCERVRNDQWDTGRAHFGRIAIATVRGDRVSVRYVGAKQVSNRFYVGDNVFSLPYFRPRHDLMLILAWLARMATAVDPTGVDGEHY